MFSQQKTENDLFFLSQTEQVTNLITCSNKVPFLIEELRIRGWFQLRDRLDDVVSVDEFLEALTGYVGLLANNWTASSTLTVATLGFLVLVGAFAKVKYFH